MTHQITLGRIAAQWRRSITAIGVLLAVNVLVYAAAVYPLAQRVGNVEQRNRLAAQTLAAARREYEAARSVLTGKQRAETELATFYKDVLPPDLPSARRLAYPRLARLARDCGLTVERTTFNVEPVRDSTLSRATIDVALRGSYGEIRTFVYQLETAPEFLVIQDIGLAEGGDNQGDLMLTLKVATYFRAGAS